MGAPGKVSMAIFFRRRKAQTFSPWYGFLILSIIAVALTLKIIDALRVDQVVPTANVPAVSYEAIVANPDLVIAQIVEPTPALVVDLPAPELVIEQTEQLPAQFNLAVPFTSQAPTGNWDALHEDACEEASFYMVQQFYAGTPAGKLDTSLVDTEFEAMIDLQTSLGLGYSITVAESVEFILKHYGLKAVVIDDPSVLAIKELIVAGKPVIVPAAGRELGNPFFSGDGPLYHMLIIRGYTETTFITNDPGTRMGENYVYDFPVLMSAIGDWNSGDPVTGASRILYIEPGS